MEPEPWAPPCLLEGRGPRGEQTGGHEVPTCLGSHRGAEESLETGGTELADRPHVAEVPRRTLPAPTGQAGAGRGLAGAVQLSSRLPGAGVRR